MKRKVSAVISIIIVFALLLSGTFAWINFSQNVTNEWNDTTTPGGTTHDDFCKPKKDVYIENWGKVPLFVRIRLDEYMEIGEGAALKGTYSNGNWTKNPNNHSISLMPGANINDKTTWQPHIPYTVTDPTVCKPSDPGFHDYWKWTMGGQKYYMPADASIRNDPTKVAPIDTYNYNGTEAGVKQTLNATVITMARWYELECPIGNYWVIDTDGWAYWAAPLAPGTATGLLLHLVELFNDPDDSYYYAINVISQMATKTGAQNYTDFFNNIDNDHKATNEGKDLLEIITGNKVPGQVLATDIKFDGRNKTIVVGEEYTPGYIITPPNSTSTITWNSNSTGVATVTANGKIKGISVGVAKITISANGKTDEITINVTAADVHAKSVTIRGGNKNMTVGDKYTPGYDVDPTNCTYSPTWSSSNTAVATVNSVTGEIEAKGVGKANITITIDGKSNTIEVTVVAAVVHADSVKIKGGDKDMTVGDKYTPDYEVNPTNCTYSPTWSSNNTAVATVNSATGEIEAKGVGEAIITVTIDGKTDTIKVKVSNSVDPLIGTINGEGPYDTKWDDEDEDKNYTLVIKTKASDFSNEELLQSIIRQQGSIKLSDILSGSNYSGIGVKAQNSALSKYFSIGTDKDGDPALMYTYIAPKSAWDAGFNSNPPKLPVETINLLLTKNGFRDTPIKIIVRYNTSTYINQ